MSDFIHILDRLTAGKAPSIAELERLLNAGDAEEKLLQSAAYDLKSRLLGRKVFLRGLIEFSNYCTCDCLYCGIRKSNTKVKRFTLTLPEIVSSARIAKSFRYGSVVLQSGERRDDNAVEFIAKALRQIKAVCGEDFGITLSCGVQTQEVYRYWKSCGAERYLLRIESSDPELFSAIHPPEISYAERRKALIDLKECGYILGTGVMIGIPGQTVSDLAHDLDFFRELDVDMIGMGPFLSHCDVPLQEPVLPPEALENRFHLALKMIAAARLLLKDVNIASTTALQALYPASGREMGLLYGANVIMPNVGDVAHRADYTLYNDKPGLDENAESVRQALENSLASIGESIAFDIKGTPLHFIRKSK